MKSLPIEVEIDRINSKIKIKNRRKSKKAGKVVKTIPLANTRKNNKSILRKLIPYIRSLVGYAGNITKAPESIFVDYLEMRSNSIAQQTLNKEASLINSITGYAIKAPPSKVKQSKYTHETRAYEPEQIDLIIQACDDPKLRLCIEICLNSGCRTSELLTLRRLDERKPSSHRDWSPDLFLGRKNDFVIYTVKGKGQLVRQIAIDIDLAQELEQYRLENPKKIYGSSIAYYSYYDIPAGHELSKGFSIASFKALGFSHGAHGLRHTYTQERYNEMKLVNKVKSDKMAREILSQELGHFRPSILKIYLGF